MKIILKVLLVFIGVALYTDCQASHYYYIRNTSGRTVTLYFHFTEDQIGKPLPDSIYVPYSSSIAPINRKTIKNMTDSVLLRKTSDPKEVAVSIPPNGM